LFDEVERFVDIGDCSLLVDYEGGDVSAELSGTYPGASPLASAR
jgi:hypothetical protein